MSAAALLAQVRALGVTVRGSGDNLALRPIAAVPDALKAALKAAKPDVLALLRTEATIGAAPRQTADPVQPARQTRPGALPGDPPAPVVHPDATRTLARLELAGAESALRRDGSIRLAHPERATADVLIALAQHQADVAALLAYRARLDALWPT